MSAIWLMSLLLKNGLLLVYHFQNGSNNSSEPKEDVIKMKT